MVKYKLHKKGIKADIYSMIDDRGKNIFEEFLSRLQTGDKKKVEALIMFLLVKGSIVNDQKYRIIKGSDVVELKAKKQRILTHRIETNSKYKYIILSGFQKPAKKIQTRYINSAKVFSNEIIAGNTLEVQEGKNE
ncbi:MAG: hypothetical protein DRH93_09865 [Deltaproteobacteria bacterium]|nr:MAG: hypothetical protein DRH93_09865 [Deltaproteobacteria bacterium]